MVITTPSDDILVSGDPSSLYSFIASSAVSGGSVVKANGDSKVIMATSADNSSIGVALYEVPAGDAVTVAGPGCIVRCCASGTTIKAGDLVYPVAQGKVVDIDGAAYLTNWEDYVPIGIALEAQTTTLGAVKVLIR